MSAKHLPWFRFYTEAIDDEKLGLLAFEDRWHFVALLCLCEAGILKQGDPLMRRKAAVKLQITIDEFEAVVEKLAAVELLDKRTLIPAAGYVLQRCDLRPHASIWKTIRDRIFSRDDYTCQYCGARGIKLECDHVHPVSRGGSHDDSNLVTACVGCNRSKRAKTVAEWKGGKA